MLLEQDKLNNQITDRRGYYEEYFSVMDIPKIEKDKRVQLAEDIDDIYDGLFELILLMMSLNMVLDRVYLNGYLENRLIDVSDGSEYLTEYAHISAEDTVNTTLDHIDDDYYTSNDRAVFLAAEDAQTIANYEQFEKAVKSGKTHKEWRSELTKTTRKDHRNMHGTVAPIKDMFQFPDCEMMMPHDTVNGTMKQIANCRCSLKFLTI